MRGTAWKKLCRVMPTGTDVSPKRPPESPPEGVLPSIG
jgi:hypothetical protein